MIDLVGLCEFVPCEPLNQPKMSTKEEQLVIDFLKLNNFKYITKDQHNDLIAFKDKPPYKINECLTNINAVISSGVVPYLIPCPSNLFTNINNEELIEIK
jgi:hypothetical protein